MTADATTFGQAPGTRFLLYPQASVGGQVQEPEVIEVSSPPGTVGPGPTNERMYTIYPVGKQDPYGLYHTDDGWPIIYIPEWPGDTLPGAMPDENGHFDYLEPGSPQFEAAHLFGAAHFTLDIWEGFFGRQIPWHFESQFEKLELTMLPSLDNALIGWGFLETGATRTEDGELHPYSLNFDVVAHEIGHAIIYSQVGMPSPDEDSGEYYGFQESGADVVALLAALHFGSVVDDVLNNSRGNLYTYNKLSRFGELSNNKQIRLAANDRVMSEFADGWKDEHMLAQPLTGAMFDILVDIYHEFLVERRLISPQMEDLLDQLEGNPAHSETIQRLFDERYNRDPLGFREALLTARDV
ncbi:MAG: hypothetical protein ACR2OM_12255, partial [Aestuariivirgaceae bacterium]